jgi:hypothetical protein
MNALFRRCSVAVGVGAVGYWGLDVFYHVMRSEPNVADVYVLGVLLTGMMALAFLLLSRGLVTQRERMFVAISLLLAQWMCGPLVLPIYARISGAPPVESDVLVEMLLGFPLYTPLISFQNWSALGLIGSTVAVMFILLTGKKPSRVATH